MQVRLQQYLSSAEKSKEAEDEVTGIEDIGLQKVQHGAVDQLMQVRSSKVKKDAENEELVTGTEDIGLKSNDA